MFIHIALLVIWEQKYDQNCKRASLVHLSKFQTECPYCHVSVLIFNFKIQHWWVESLLVICRCNSIYDHQKYDFMIFDLVAQNENCLTKITLCHNTVTQGWFWLLKTQKSIWSSWFLLITKSNKRHISYLETKKLFWETWSNLSFWVNFEQNAYFVMFLVSKLQMIKRIGVGMLVHIRNPKSQFHLQSITNINSKHWFLFYDLIWKVSQI